MVTVLESKVAYPTYKPNSLTLPPSIAIRLGLRFSYAQTTGYAVVIDVILVEEKSSKEVGTAVA